MKNSNSIWDIIFGETITDPMFGDLLLNQRGTERFWEGNIVFAPTNQNIGITLWHLEGRVDNAQKNFYRELENRYSEMLNEIGPCLLREFLKKNDLGDDCDIWKVFKFVGFTFPTASGLIKGSFEWDMFYSYDEGKPPFLVEMLNWQPEECYSGE